MKEKRNYIVLVPPLAEKDPAGVLASFVSESSYEALPPKIVKQYKIKLLDTLASLIGGAGVHGEPVEKVLNYFRDKGGKPEARVIGYGDRLPLLSSAFVNSVACRVLDLGDIEIELDHSSEHIVPVLLSAAEAIGRVDGKTFLNALAISSEIVARIAHACFGMTEGYFKPEEIPTKLPPIQQWGVICGLAKLMDFNSEQTWDAIGHGYSTLSQADAQSTTEGTYMKCIEHGFTAINGILCCELAKAGIRGTRNVFFGPRGFIGNFYPFKNDPALLTTELGTKWVADVLQKRFASNMNTHCATQAAMDIAAEHSIAVEDIETIFCEVAPGAYYVIVPEKWQPANAGVARFSLPYAVATGLIKGKVFVDDYTDEELNRKDVRLLMTKIKAGTDDKLTQFGARVTITTRDKKSFVKELLYPPGSSQYPLTWDDIVGKLHLVINSLQIPISEKRQTEIIHMVKDIEKVKEMKDLIDLLMWQC